MKKYKQKFWIEQYTNEKIVNQWFKDYLTYLDGHFHGLQNMEEIKAKFLEIELIEIKTILNTEKNQKKAYDFIKKIINNY